jgi:hypothetical protein
MKRLAILALFGLAACGDQQMLTPRPGQHLPVKPQTAPVTPNADQLLATSARERPGRSDELLIRSQVRRDDKFDLPPQ